MTKQLHEGQPRPFLKWAGGKSQLLPEIRKVYPEGLGDTITRYAEPFLGGGAVLLDILSTYRLEAVYASDTNGDLINTYCCVRDRLEELLERLHRLESEYLPLDSQARKDFYYRIRAQFNEGQRTDGADGERASQLIFLNRTCFNGLYRVNARGEFNVPAGAYKNPTICDEDNLRRVSGLLRGVELVCAPYTQASAFADGHTFLYADPPYRPLNQTSSFTAYTKNAFGDEEQRELACFLKELAGRGVKVAASNSDPHNTDPQDDFFDELYAGCTLRRIAATRMINADASSRGKVSELLITTY